MCVCVYVCVTELEDVATDSQSGRLSSQPVVVESSHPYTDDTSTSGTVKIPGNTHTHTHTHTFILNSALSHAQTNNGYPTQHMYSLGCKNILWWVKGFY